MIGIDEIKKLREETLVSVSECKKALEEAGGDFNKAKEFLRKMGRDLAGKRAGREVNSGIIHAYIHSNKKIGVMIELRCESDFVAKSEDLKNLAHELCLQITAAKEDTPVLEQDWVKNPGKKIKDIFDEYAAKIGEKIALEKYIRYEI